MAALLAAALAATLLSACTQSGPGTGPASLAAAAAPGGLAAETSATGSFAHALPIQVPGFHGIEPRVSLDYDSAAGNGEVGVGWRLQVGSTITRSGTGGGLPLYDSSDGFVVDGQKLVACAPHCRTGGTHESRQQSFERFVFDGTTWTRWHRDGVKLVYEVPNGDPATAYQWALARVVDTHGNTVTYSQDCPNHCFFDRITYAAGSTPCGAAGQPACKAGADIGFIYELRPDVVTYPTGKGTAQIRQRLRTIAVRMDGHLVTTYALKYAANPSTGNSVLRSLQQFPSDAAVAPDGTVTAGPTPPLPAVTFAAPSMSAPQPQWTTGSIKGSFAVTSPPGQPSFPRTETSIPGRLGRFSVDGDPQAPRSPLYGDFDGDGRADVASGTVGPPCGLQVRLGLNPEVITTTKGVCATDAYVADLNGDRVDDLLLGDLRRALSNRDGTFTIDGNPASAAASDKFRQCAVGDLNGDDLGDLACVSQSANMPPQLSTRRSAPDGGWIAADVPLPAAVTSVANVALLTTGDADASTTSDIMLAIAFKNSPWTLVTGYTAPNGSIASWGTTTAPWGRGTEDLAAWSLSSGDVNRDARADYILIGHAGGSVVGVAISEKGPQFRPVAEQVHTSAFTVAVGDFDGDGADDLLTGDPAGVFRSNGDGTFSQHQSLTSASATPKSCSVPDPGFDPVAAAADVNGDGQADLVCATFVWGPAGHHDHFDVWAQPSPTAPPAPHRWTPFDHNGDGRQDLFAVHYRNPGYEVYTLLAQPGGGYALSHAPVLPDPALPDGPPLDNPDAAGWMPGDVGSEDGAPDGRSDLVRVDRVGSRLRVTTLLSTTSGWSIRPDAPWRVNGAEVQYGARDVRSWQPAELNGDDRMDLVHFVPLATGVRVEYLISHGDGTWTADGIDAFQSAGPGGEPLTRKDVGSFRVVDLNRDGLSDFTHVEVGGGPSSSYLTIRSLISTGPAAWREETWQRFQPIDTAAAHRLQFIDFDGDGVPDLGRATVDAGCIEVEAYRHGLTGWSSPLTAGTPPSSCLPAGSLEDRRNLTLGDVNGDGRTDVRYLSRTGSQGPSISPSPSTSPGATNTVLALLNPGDPTASKWRLIAPAALPVSYSDSWAWIGLDTDSDGRSEFAHVDPGQLATLQLTTASDRITEIDNGRGAATSIVYHAQPGARAYLPAGMLPIVVDEITVSDFAYSPPVRARAQFGYDGARWSTQYRQMTGYQAIRSEQGPATIVTGYDLSDTCGARQSSFTRTADGGVISKTTTTFRPSGSAAPFTCLPDTVEESECELTTQCLIKQTGYGYDDYGNVTTADESAGTLRRRTSTPVHPNTADYIVDRPYQREILIPDPAAGTGTWRTEAKTLFGYDDDTFEHAPHQHGDLTRITAFSDLAADAASETFQQYDDAGNLRWTQNPVGIVTTTDYDTDRKLFPVSACTPVGCTTTTWDETLGVARTVTDPNQQTTTTDHDAFGRPTTTTRPDSSTTAIRYLQTGTVTGPDGARQRIRTEISDGSPGDGVHWHENLIDGLGRTYRTLDEPPVNTPTLMTETRYADASDRPAAVSLPHSRGQSARWTSYCYDPAHRLTVTAHPGTATGDPGYCDDTAHGPGTNTGQTTRTYNVGAVEDSDELGHLTTTRHDGFGRTTEVDEHIRPCDSCDSETQATHYTYDALDKLRTVTDAADHTTTIVRDALSRETSITDPDRGTRTLTWYADGTLEEEHDANGVHTWTYDTAGRPQTRTDTGATGAQTARWDYDRDPATKQPLGYSTGHTTLITYAATGAQGSVKGTDRFWYDQLGRIVQARHCVDAVCHDMGYTYDDAGRIKDLRYPKPGDPDGEHVKYTYDPAGHLTSVGSYLTGIDYDATGQPTQQIYGNGLIEQFTYDPDRLWADTQTLANTPKPIDPLYAATYTHDLTARITTLTTTNAAGTTAQPVTEDFTYDDLGRLATHRSSDRPSLLPEKYVYDALGRITESPTAGTYSYDDPAHLHAATSTSAGYRRAYDTAGNLKRLTDPGGRDLRLTWTPQGMPQTIADGRGATTMAYGADGQRVKRTRGSDTTYYFDRYFEQNGNGLTRYYWAGDRLIARRDPNGSVSYLLQDHVHSTRVVTGQSQAVHARYNYEPYGRQKTGNQTDDTSQLWQGYKSDADSGLVYMNARYYDPELGQFTAPDSIIPNTYRPQSLNRYSFTENDAGVNADDPSGHMSMRVELKKEQEFDGLRFGAMYARALLGACTSGGPGQGVPCPAALAPDVIRYHAEVCLSCSDPSEWDNPFQARAGIEAPSAPPLITGEDAPLTAPPLITGEDAPLTAPPLITGEDAPLTAPPLITGKDAPLTAPPLIAARRTLNAPHRAPSPSANPDIFVWASGTAPGLRFGSVEFLQEGVAVAGFNAIGPYYGYIYALGVEVGEKEGAYGASFLGIEKIWQYRWGGGGYTTEVVPIALLEGGAEGFVAGAYTHDLTSEGTGVYAGAAAEHFAAGVGINLDWLTSVIPFLGRMSNLRTTVILPRF